MNSSYERRARPAADEGQPFDEGEPTLAEVADWGPAEDWSDWAGATGGEA